MDGSHLSCVGRRLPKAPRVLVVSLLIIDALSAPKSKGTSTPRSQAAYCAAPLASKHQPLRTAGPTDRHLINLGRNINDRSGSEIHYFAWFGIRDVVPDPRGRL